MSVLHCALNYLTVSLRMKLQTYSNGASEVILGNAIKQLNLPREGIVVMTKVRVALLCSGDADAQSPFSQIWGVVARDPGAPVYRDQAAADNDGYVNQHGLSRKVCRLGSA